MKDMEWLIWGIILIPFALYLSRYGRELWGIWKEPVLKYPVVIFESDDWGPAEESEADCLERIADTLVRHKDRTGRHPVMTLGMVLSVPDAKRIRDCDGKHYHALRLDAPQFAGIRAAIAEGVERGVFAVQLHGMAHYLPETLMRAAASNAKVAAWLISDGTPDPRELPDALQSRWIDGSELPSVPLEPAQIIKRASEEAQVFRDIFGTDPCVAVPPTFIWQQAVEQGWAREGIRYIVTPGTHFEKRDALGRPLGDGGRIRNGERSHTSGIYYLVRDRYFEPALGHAAAQAADAVADQWSLRRPALLEIHRFNFNGGRQECDRALDEVDHALRLMTGKHPDLRFLSTQVLAERITKRAPDFVERSFSRRFYWFQKRVRSEMPLIRRLLPI